MTPGHTENTVYGTVTAAIVDELRGICGADAVLSESDTGLSRYSHDQIPDRRYGHAPDAVVKPASAEEVRRIMLIAARERIPVTPRGGGSGLSGGAVPVHGGIVLSTERMNRVLEIDTDNMIAVVEPGVVTNELDKALRDTGLFFAGYPLSEEFCFIGGNVAENAGGGRAVKYGVTARYITGLELVTAAGEIMTLGGKRYKDVTGYDLLHLLIGSEGTLAVFTKVFIRLLPRPLHRLAVKASFAGESEALAAVPFLLRDPAIAPSAVEFLDTVSISEAVRYLSGRVSEELLPATESPLLLVEVDGHDAARVGAAVEAAATLCRAQGASGIAVARTEAELDAVWLVRKQIPWALKRMSTELSPEDVVVPVADAPQLLAAIRELETRYGVRIPCFGHAADGNYHASPMRPDDLPLERWDSILDRLLRDLYRVVDELGGTISGEHGIGHKRLGYLPLVIGEAQMELMRGIKRVFDPAGILNPGKAVV